MTVLGFRNNTFDNHCFLNVLLQGFLHLNHSAATCLWRNPSAGPMTCALHKLFTDASNKNASPASRPYSSLCCEDVRKALVSGYEIGTMNDVIECLESLLEVLHKELGTDDNQNEENASSDKVKVDEEIHCNCPVHKYFTTRLGCTWCCKFCDAQTTMSSNFTLAVHNIPTALLSDAAPLRRLDDLLKLSVDDQTWSKPCEQCKENSNCDVVPDNYTTQQIFFVRLTFPTNPAQESEIHELHAHPERFNGLFTMSWAGDKCASVTCVMCISYDHYICYVRQRVEGNSSSSCYYSWFYCNDERVEEIGTWAQMWSHIERSFYVPYVMIVEVHELDNEKSLCEICTHWNDVRPQTKQDALVDAFRGRFAEDAIINILHGMFDGDVERTTKYLLQYNSQQSQSSYSLLTPTKRDLLLPPSPSVTSPDGGGVFQRRHSSFSSSQSVRLRMTGDTGPHQTQHRPLTNTLFSFHASVKPKAKKDEYISMIQTLGGEVVPMSYKVSRACHSNTRHFVVISTTIELEDMQLQKVVRKLNAGQAMIRESCLADLRGNVRSARDSLSRGEKDFLRETRGESTAKGNESSSSVVLFMPRRNIRIAANHQKRDRSTVSDDGSSDLDDNIRREKNIKGENDSLFVETQQFDAEFVHDTSLEGSNSIATKKATTVPTLSVRPNTAKRNKADE